MASRLCDACPAGEVFVDATTVVVRGNRHEPAVALHDRLMLRGFDAPRDVWSVKERLRAGAQRIDLGRAGARSRRRRSP